VLVAKLLFCSTLAFGSLVVLRMLQGRASEERILRALVIAITIAKFPIVLLVYHLVPNLVQGSDALLFYYPQVTSVLQGLLPYRDFASSYSPLFPYVLAPLVALWHSVGAIALTMLVFESAMLAVYLRHAKARGFEHRWRIAFLYAFSPMSVYWIGLTGYNGSMLAFFAVLAFVLADRGRDMRAGLSLGLGLLTTKILMGLFWPAIPFAYRRIGRVALGAVGVSALGFSIAMALGMDFLEPVKHEAFRESSGNLWFVLSTVLPVTAQDGAVWKWLPIVSYVLAFGALGGWFVRRRVTDERRFDAAMVFATLCCLFFLVLSRKSHLFYLAMMGLFILHTASLGSRDRMRIRDLIPFAILNTVMTIEPHFWHWIRDAAVRDPKIVRGLVAMDLVLLAGYVFYVWLGIAALRGASLAPIRGGPSPQGRN
jgi:Glycosyltransferase family 87